MEAISRNRLIDELKPEVLKLSITDVVDSRLEGSRLSPFREDHSEGSFMLDESRGICTDFAEGVTRNQIRFIMDYDGVDFQEAVLRLAYEAGIIEKEQYERVSSDKSFRVPEKLKKAEEPETAVEEKRSPEVLDEVYRAVKKYSRLSEQHREYLLKRGVHKEDLSRYFTYDDSLTGFVLLELERKGYNVDILYGVPGFYQDSSGNPKMVSGDGICIPMMDADGLISSLQIRKDEIKEKEARYKFISSRSFERGCSPGAQVSVEAPRRDGRLFITEGVFKAIEMRHYFKNTVISVQGVNNTKPLLTEIPKLLKFRSISEFVIAFDADMQHNDAVKKAAKKLHVLLEQYDIPIRYMVWDEKFGKGADDCIMNGNAEHFEFVDAI